MAEIEALFLHGPRVAPDPKHSGDEDRLIAVGRTGTGRPLFVAFTMRAKDSRHLIRPVTARYMHAREIAAYEKQLMKKKVPRLRTDEEAEAFLAQDLSKLDFSQFKIVRFEFEKKDEQINMRVPKPLLAAVKARAKARGIPYTRFIRETLEQAVGGSK